MAHENPNRRFSIQTVLVLEHFLKHEFAYGHQITKEIGLKGGTIYPMLKRLKKQQVLDSEWVPENDKPREQFSLHSNYSRETLKKAIERARNDIDFMRGVDNDL